MLIVGGTNYLEAGLHRGGGGGIGGSPPTGFHLELK